MTFDDVQQHEQTYTALRSEEEQLWAELEVLSLAGECIGGSGCCDAFRLCPDVLRVKQTSSCRAVASF
eukprot:1060423-Amphidinium_carterae.1